MLFTIISTAAFIYKNYTDSELIINALVLVLAGIQSIGMFISISLNMNKIKMLHLKLQEIIDTGNFSSMVCIKCKFDI